MRTYRFRLYPSKTQETEMMRHLWLAKNLWNELLSHCKEFYKNFTKFPTREALQLMVKNTGLFSQTAQEVAHRIEKALWRSVKLKKQGIKAGFPRFKTFERMKSLYYPQAGFLLRNKLKVNPFGEIQIVRHREIQGMIKTLTIKRAATGKWFASFLTEQQVQPIQSNSGDEIGIDLGLKSFATLSNGTTFNNPRHLECRQYRLSLLQRKLSKKQKEGKNRLKARRKVSLLHEKASNARADFLHKLSRQLVNSYSFIAIEDIASQRMAGQRFGRQINDAAWTMFAGMLCYKAESAGCKVVPVNPNNTSKMCSNCGSMQEMPLSERVYECISCGMLEDRDINAAINILNRARAGIARSNACGEEGMPSSMMQEVRAFRCG